MIVLTMDSSGKHRVVFEEIPELMIARNRL